MSEQSRNEGIIISGGKIKAEQIAVGKAASIQKTVNAATASLEDRGLQDIIVKLNDLVDSIKSHEGSIGNSNELFETTEIIAGEFEKEKPNKLTITTLLDGIANSFGSLTAIASSATKLKDLVIALL